MELVKTKYKQTEVGLIPEDWNSIKLGELAIISTGNTPPTMDKSNYGDEYLFVSPADLGRNKWINKTDKKLSVKGFSISRKFPKNSILFTCIGSTIGKSGIASLELTSNQQINAIFPNENYITEFVYYGLDSISKKIKSLAGEQAVPLVNKSEFSEFKIPLPPTLAEQKAIATALSDVDALITNLEKLIAKKKAIKQGAMQELLTGKTRLAGFGEGMGYKQTEVGVVPEDWDIKLLPEVVNFIHGKAHERNIVEDGQYEVVNSKFVSSEGKVVKYSKVNFCPAKKNDILTVLSDLPNGKALAKCFFVEKDNKYAVNQRVCIWRTKGDNPLFLNYILNRHKYFLKFDDGVTQTHILNHHIKNCPILIPSNKEEQKAIGKTLYNMALEIKSLKIKKSKYQRIKQGMMQELLTGKTRLV